MTSPFTYFCETWDRHRGLDPLQHGWASYLTAGALTYSNAYQRKDLRLDNGDGIKRVITLQGRHLNLSFKMFRPTVAAGETATFTATFHKNLSNLNFAFGSTSITIGTQTYTFPSTLFNSQVRVMIDVVGVNGLNARATLSLNGIPVIKNEPVAANFAIDEVRFAFATDQSSYVILDNISLTTCADSFETLIEKAAYDKFTLVEITPFQDITSALTVRQQATLTYEASWGNVQHTNPIGIRVGGKNRAYADYTEVSSVSEVLANPDTWYYENGNNLVINLPAAPGPDLTVLVKFPLYFSDTGIRYQYYYEPLLISGGEANIKAADNFWGFPGGANTSITLANPDRYFDTIWSSYIWENQSLRILIGSSLIPLSEFKAIFTGRITDKNHQKNQVSISASNELRELAELVPAAVYKREDWPNIPSSSLGKTVPMLFGTFNGDRKAPLICVNEKKSSSGSQTYDSEWNVAGGSYCLPFQSLPSAGVDYWDGQAWRKATVISAHVTTGLVRIGDYSSTIINKDSTLRAQVVGKLASAGGGTLNRGPHILEKCIVDILGRGEWIESATLIKAKDDAELDLSVYVADKTSVNELARAIAQSEMGFWHIDGEGKLHYRIWEPQIPTAPVQVSEYDQISFQTKTDFDTIGRYTRVGYSKRWTGDQAYQWTPPSAPADDSAFYKYGASKPHEFETLVDNSSDAEILRQRYDLIYRTPTREISINAKWKGARFEPFDKVLIYHSAGPGISGNIDGEVFEVTGVGIGRTNTTIELTDQKGMGLTIGVWQSANAAPSWISATAQQRLSQIWYWADDNGFADPSSPTSQMTTKWW